MDRQSFLFGSGTEGVEQEAKRLFPGKKVVRIDRDSASRKHAFETLHQEFESGGADILVGTEIVAKGLDFQMWNSWAFSMPMRDCTFPIFVQKNGHFNCCSRSLDEPEDGKCFNSCSQTRLPNHPLFAEVLRGDYESFFSSRNCGTKKHFLPPFSQVIKLIL